MSDPAAWLRKAQDELEELEATAETDRADAWRAAVLVARLLGAPEAAPPAAEIVRRLPRILAAVGRIEPEPVLQQLAEDLGSDDDPWGTLLDTLLDVDDMIGVLELSDARDDAGILAARAAALVSLYPERVVPVGPFATMRLATLRDDVASALVWHAVERAPAEVLAEGLPALAPPATSSRSKRADLDCSRSLSLPRVLHFAAAASSAGEVFDLVADGAETGAWIYAEAGRMLLEVRDLTSSDYTVTLAVERVGDGAEVAREDVEITISGATAYADLGPWAGDGNLLHRLVARSGLSAEQVALRLLVTRG